MKIQIITDAWLPQVNGVVTTLQDIVSKLSTIYRDQIDIIEPSQFWTIPCPTYPEIRLTLNPGKLKKRIEEFKPDCIHIATIEGPIGNYAARYCIKQNIPYTTSYHTKIPEYIHARFPFIKPEWVYSWLKKYHNQSINTLVTNHNMKQELSDRGFTNLKVWTRGVDVTKFNPNHMDRDWRLKYEAPIMLYCGRVSIEKNLEAFLSLRMPGTKVVVGDGPDKLKLEQKYPNVKFLGVKFGDELAKYYASSDVFVFPSKLDTFGVVMLEAFASGTPVAAYPVTGPLDVIEPHVNGVYHSDLKIAIEGALRCDRDLCYNTARKYDWINVVNIFRANLVTVEV